VPVGAAAEKAPSITVTPHTGLKPGQTVHVKGTGFTPNDAAFGVQCPAGTKDPSACDLFEFVEVPTDASGAFATDLTVHRRMFAGTGILDCATVSCEVLFSPAQAFVTTATKTIAFDPSAPFPPTTAAARPSSRLVDRQSIKIVGSGFTEPGEFGGPFVLALECLANKFVCATEADGVVGKGGRFGGIIEVRRMITTPSGARVDCAQRRGRCDVLLFDAEDADYLARAPLAFDASVPPPPAPTLVVTPRTKLPYYARVQTSGKHWRPDDLVPMTECGGAGLAVQCVSLMTLASADSAGTFHSAPMLQRMLSDPFFHTGTTVDCAKPKSACQLSGMDSDGDFVTVPVAFDPKAPVPPPPTASTKPASPFRRNQVVQIKGKGFPANAQFEIEECGTGPTLGECFSSFGGSEATDAHGNLATAFQVQPLDVDCARKRVTCALQITSEGGAQVVLPFRFRSGGGATASAEPLVRVPEGPQRSWLSVARARLAHSPSPLARAALAATTK
jgi:hypothetical protein